MNKKTLLAAALLAVGLGASFAASAQDYRLAHSRAENMEVFVEGATKDNWCALVIEVRATHGGTADKQAWSRLLPKLGALLGQQCPQAAVVNWRETDASGKQLARGTSRAAQGWQLTPPAVAAAPTPAVTAAPAAPAPAVSQPAAPTPAPEAAPAPAVEVAAAPVAAAPTAAAPTAAAPTAAAPTAAAPAPVPEPAPEPAPATADAAAPEPAPAAPAAQPASPPAAQEPSQAAVIGRAIGEAAGSAVQATTQMAEQAAEQAAQAVDSAGQMATDAGKAVAEAAQQAAQAAVEAAQQAAQVTSEAAQQAAQATSEMAQQAAQATLDAARQAQQAAVEAGTAAAEGYRSRVAEAPAVNIDKVEPPPAPRPPLGLADFAVGGWQPPSAGQRTELGAFLSVKQDQNGCKIVSTFDLGDQAAYISLQSENLTCGADGYAQGKGRLSLLRSDGKQIARSSDLWFSKGLVFNRPVQDVAPADIVARAGEDQPGRRQIKAVWFGLRSDADSKSHYLLRAALGLTGQMGSSIGVWQLSPQLDVLTAQAEDFRQIASIRAAVDRALRVLPDSVMPDAAFTRLFFADDAQGLWIQDQDKLLYNIEASRQINGRTGKPQGDWRYDVQYARNFLFQREKREAERQRREAERKRQEEERLAQQKRQEEERLARQQRIEEERQARLQRQQEERLAQQQRMEEERKERERLNQLRQQARAEQDNLRRYQELEQLAEKGGPDALRQRMERDFSYGSFGMTSLYSGGQDTIKRAVRVDGVKDGDATVDWPYPMRLTGQKDLAKGWYWVTGERRMDAKQLDEDGLPLSLVTAMPEQIQACEQPGCTDIINPLALTRAHLGRSDWTPQAAQAVIDSAPKGW
jgi:hypothetical protein